MGPVEENELLNIFTEGKIQADSYVWCKGFANWEKLHDVEVLKYFLEDTQTEDTEKESPEVKFHFDWNNFQSTDEIFYIKVGEDRLQNDSEVLGPYSLQELNGAFLQKRINEQTFIYTPGMLYWERIGAVAKLQNLWSLDDSVPSSLDMQSPDIVVLDRVPVPLMSIIKKIHGNTMTILCNHHFMEGEDLLVSLYKKEELQVKNIKLKVVELNQFNQTIECDFTHINDDQKKILNEHA
jgi:hypothetical protein